MVALFAMLYQSFSHLLCTRLKLMGNKSHSSSISFHPRSVSENILLWPSHGFKVPQLMKCRQVYDLKSFLLKGGLDQRPLQPFIDWCWSEYVHQNIFKEHERLLNCVLQAIWRWIPCIGTRSQLTYLSNSVIQ